MTTPLLPIDHQAQAIKRLAVQFRESTNLKNYITAILQEGEDLETVFNQILNERSIDTAVGTQLDIIGELVGRSRSVINGAYVPFFGFPDNGTGFNTNKFWDGLESIFATGFLSDGQYRLYIKAKIASNHADGAYEDFVTVFKILFGPDTGVMINDIGNAKVQIFIAHEFMDSERLLIQFDKENKVLPRPAGVKILYSELPASGPFGFAANPLATGFNVGGFPTPLGESLEDLPLVGPFGFATNIYANPFNVGRFL